VPIEAPAALVGHHPRRVDDRLALCGARERPAAQQRAQRKA
jgi:hypothetical protein